MERVVHARRMAERMRTAAGTKEKKRMIGTGFNKPFSGKQDRLEGAHKPWSGPEGGKAGGL